MSLYRSFYFIKPLIPRRLQIHLRRALAATKRKIHRDKWPIHPATSRPPEGWSGWPGNKKFALVLSHDVDTAKGHDKVPKLLELEKRLGFRSSFNFVPEGYPVSSEMRERLVENGFAIGVHGLTHDGKLFKNRRSFEERAPRINRYLKEWGSAGFHAPSMLSNLNWISELDIEYSCSSFDTDPFEPHPDGVNTIFPFLIKNSATKRTFAELPYTLPQDHCLFVILKENDIGIWKKKLDWIAENGGMALLNTHPDYMRFEGGDCGLEEYPAELYVSFLKHIEGKYSGQYWAALPLEVSNFCKSSASVPEIISSRISKKSELTGPTRTVWIDLDNTPHVPFFMPIKTELERRGYRILLTARDAYQVCELATKYGLIYKKVGRHFGKHKILKIYGWISRALALAPFALRTRPALALSHGSRSQVLISKLLRIPTVVIMDYEHSKIPPFTRPDFEIVPEIISKKTLPGKEILTYPGLKEDVYIPFFTPDPRILDELGLTETDLIVTVRPPATEAHYHNPTGERLFVRLMEWILDSSRAIIVLVPRNARQAEDFRRHHAGWFVSERVVVPKKAVDGLNLLFFSDLVISGGGTMNREAAALGVPVYSIFMGPKGEVDRYLESHGRLVMIDTPEDIERKIKMTKREKAILFEAGNRPALEQIISHLDKILKSQDPRQLDGTG